MNDRGNYIKQCSVIRNTVKPTNKPTLEAKTNFIVKFLIYSGNLRSRSYIQG